MTLLYSLTEAVLVLQNVLYAEGKISPRQAVAIVSDQSIVKLPLFSKLRHKHEVGDEMEVSTMF